MSSSKPEQLLAYELSCPICLQIFSDPLVLPCGHNYCRVCIYKTSEILCKNGNGTLPHCPECRKEYDGVDCLQRNFKLCSIIEGYLATAPKQDSQSELVKRTEFFCDQCIDEESEAVKICLRCEVSLCSRHLQRHHEKESFRAHTLVEPHELGMRGCTTHKRPLEYFCSSDMTSLCATCVTEGFHQNHDVLTLEVAEDEMRRALESRNKVISCRLQMTESVLQMAAEEQGAAEAAVETLVNKAVTVMDSMATLLNRYREHLSVLLDEERGQRRQSWQLCLTELKDQQQHLLDAQQSATEALSETDTCLFINSFMLIEHQLRETITSTIPSKIPSNAAFNTRRLQGGFKTQDFRLAMTYLLDSLYVLLNPLELTFNSFTAHPSLTLSNDQRTVKYSTTKQQYGEHPQRFISAPQVLCTQGFSGGEHVWVVEMGANSMWSLGLCYKSIPRRGDHSRLGRNTVSWRLQWKNKKLTACHASTNVALGEITYQLLRIEVALDYEKGILSFHSIKGHRVHLHTFSAVFREPVYPAFSIHSNTPESWVTLQSGI